MRRHHWSAPILAAVALLSGGRAAIAQSGAFADDGLAPYRLAAEAQPRDPIPFDADQPMDDPPLEAPVFDPNAGFYPPPAFNSPINPAGMPPGARPWPEISPFAGPQFQQQANEGGLWFDETRNGGRQWYGGAGFLAARVRRPNARPVGTQLGTLLLNLQSDAFASVKLSTVFPFDMKTGGLEGWIGFTNPDESGMQLNAWWLSDVKQTYSRGTGFGDLANPEYLFDTNAIIWANLVNGTADQQPYDRLFKLTYQTQAAGTTLSYLLTPWRRSNWYSVRPMIGARYLLLQEKFTFLGSDSGLTYTIDPSTNQPDPTTVNPNPNGIPGFDAYMQSRVDSHLAGPEIGVRYEIGGSGLRFWGTTKVGLLGNYQRMNLEGENLGDFFNQDWRLFDTQFNQRDYSAHVSPSFEQAFFVEASIFQFIPIVNRYSLFEEAKLRLGYSLFYVGEVARPEDNIIYRGFPNFPELKPSFSKWSTSNFNVSINWDF